MATVIELIDRARDLLNEPLDSTRTFPDDSSSFFKDTTLRRYLNISIEEVGIYKPSSKVYDIPIKKFKIQIIYRTEKV